MSQNLGYNPTYELSPNHHQNILEEVGVNKVVENVVRLRLTKKMPIDATQRPLKIPPQYQVYAEQNNVFDLFQVSFF